MKPLAFVLFGCALATSLALARAPADEPKELKPTNLAVNTDATRTIRN